MDKLTAAREFLRVKAHFDEFPSNYNRLREYDKAREQFAAALGRKLIMDYALVRAAEKIISESEGK